MTAMSHFDEFKCYHLTLPHSASAMIEGHDKPPQKKSTFKGFDDSELFFQTWPVAAPSAVI